MFLFLKFKLFKILISLLIINSSVIVDLFNEINDTFVNSINILAKAKAAFIGLVGFKDGTIIITDLFIRIIIFKLIFYLITEQNCNKISLLMKYNQLKNVNYYQILSKYKNTLKLS